MTIPKATIAKIKEHLRIETLETRNHDGLDFHTDAVWEVRNALRAAYDAGRADALLSTGPRGSDESELLDALREQLSPEAIAAIAAFLQPARTNNPAVDRQVRWFHDQLVELVGGPQAFARLMNELRL